MGGGGGGGATACRGPCMLKLHFLTPLWDATRCRWLIGVSPLVNPLYTEFHFPEVFLRLLEPLHDSYFHFCELALET